MRVRSAIVTGEAHTVSEQSESGQCQTGLFRTRFTSQVPLFSPVSRCDLLYNVYEHAVHDIVERPERLCKRSVRVACHGIISYRQVERASCDGRTDRSACDMCARYKRLSTQLVTDIT